MALPVLFFFLPAKPRRHGRRGRCCARCGGGPRGPRLLLPPFFVFVVDVDVAVIRFGEARGSEVLLQLPHLLAQAKNLARIGVLLRRAKLHCSASLRKVERADRLRDVVLRWTAVNKHLHFRLVRQGVLEQVREFRIPERHVRVLLPEAGNDIAESAQRLVDVLRLLEALALRFRLPGRVRARMGMGQLQHHIVK